MNAPAQISNHKDSAPSPAERLWALASAEMAAVDTLILDRMQSPVGMIPDLAKHLVGAGGKRLRPLLTVACARLCGYDGESHYKLAAAVEFIHSATLLHDDVVDESALRRGKKPANLIWGNSASILVGDFLFARAFNLMVETDNMRALGILSNASSVIAEGEVQQLAALDYGGFESALGKSIGDDFREGKVTLPLIRAYQTADTETAAFWTRVIVEHNQEDVDLEKAVSILRAAGALQSTLDMAHKYAADARQALNIFPESDWRNTLQDLADYVVDRIN